MRFLHLAIVGAPTILNPGGTHVYTAWSAWSYAKAAWRWTRDSRSKGSDAHTLKISCEAIKNMNGLEATLSTERTALRGFLLVRRMGGGAPGGSVS